jgi:thioredoxin reductase
MAVIGRDQSAADLAIELLLWTKVLVLCTEGDLECDDVARRQLVRGGVGIDCRKIARLDRDGDKLIGVRFEDGSLLPRVSVYISPRQRQRSPLAERMGCEILADNSIQCCENGSTCIPGLFVVGNASRGVQLVIEAAAEGTRAAVAINNALLEADAEAGTLNGQG